MRVYLSNPTGRKTNAHILELGEHDLFFSYATLIAYRGPNGKARIVNSWGPTTGRHFKELGCAGFPVVDSDGLKEIVLEATAA